MTASNAQGFKFDYDSQSGKYGYVVSEGGADTFVPFSSGSEPIQIELRAYNANTQVILSKTYLQDFTKVKVIATGNSSSRSISSYADSNLQHQVAVISAPVLNQEYDLITDLHMDSAEYLMLQANTSGWQRPVYELS